MIEPIVAVIVPVFNVAEYLPKCLDSVCSQTLQEIEIIIVCDGQDADKKICEDYAARDKRIQLVKDINRGLGGARNAGLALATAPYVVFVDSDDWIQQDYCALMLKRMQNNGVDLVHCETNIVYTKKCLKKIITGDKEYFSLKYSGVTKYDNEIIGNVDVAAWNKMYKLNMIRKYSILFPEKMQNEDAYFSWAYISTCSKIYYEKTQLYNYLRREGSLMDKTFNRQMNKEMIDHLIVGELFYDFLQRNALFSKNVKAFWNAYVVCSWYSLEHTCEEYRDIIEKRIFNFIRGKDISFLFDDPKFGVFREVLDKGVGQVVETKPPVKTTWRDKLRPTLPYRVIRKIYHALLG